MYKKTFLNILKRILMEKDLNVEFDFYLLSRSKNVHMGWNCSTLTLPEHVAIISDIGNISIKKRQDTKIKFIMLQLIHTTKWKFDYIIFRKSTWFFKKWLLSTKDVRALHMFPRELITVLEDMMFGLLRETFLNYWVGNWFLLIWTRQFLTDITEE